MAAFSTGDIVRVDDTPDIVKRYGWGSARWKIISLWNTNTEGFMAGLVRVGKKPERRNVLTSLLRRDELPPALR